MSFKVQYKPFLGLLMSLLLAFPAFAQLKDPPMLSVRGTEAYLYASQGNNSEIITKLEQGEKLTPLANIPGLSETWHIVKTQKGILGWVRSSDIQGVDELEKIFKESASELSLSRLPIAPSTPSTPPLEKAVTVPVEANGSVVIVPVVLNRSLKTYMIMDTGASLTMITPRIAKKLRLRLFSRISVMTANGRITVPLARLGSLKVGNAEVHSLMATVQNFSLDPRIEGLLGLNFLNRFHTSIDSRRQLLTLAPR